jgi:hypothetical protein
MARLPNTRHENLAQQLFADIGRGKSHGDSYIAAGYRVKKGHTADSAASRLLLTKVDIMTRVQELQAAAAKKTGVTVETLLAELEQAREAAQTKEQYSASVQAVLGKARITGLLRDRIEVGGPGEFSSCQTVDEILDRFALGCDDVHETLELIDRFRERLLQRAGDRARVVAPSAS